MRLVPAFQRRVKLLLAGKALEDDVADNIEPQPTGAAADENQAYRERLITAVDA